MTARLGRRFTALLCGLALSILPGASHAATNRLANPTFDYCTPVLVVLLSVAVLKERMTFARWAFVLAGFAGMLLIVRPGASILNAGALYALGAAGCYAMFQLVTRKLRGDDPRVTLFFQALLGTLVMTALLPFFDHSAQMTWTHIAILVFVVMISIAGHFLFILAFQRAPASGLTAFTYVQLVWAMLAGWVAFDQFPDSYTFAGIGIIAGSGLMLAWHERRRQRALALAAEPTAVD